MNCNELADLLFPDIKNTPDYYEKLYPQRNLSDGAEVTRMAPSPTGFIHLGNLFCAVANERIAHQSNGTFYLRIEDTDEKRKVDGAVEIILSTLKYFGIEFDEGAEITADNSYAPFYQRQRAEIYQTYVKEMIKRGLAYPCFCTEDELELTRANQIDSKLNPGYYGIWAKCRDLSLDEIKQNLEKGLPYVIRLMAQGNGINKLSFKDEIKGEITLLENDQDIVLLKKDGIPTYHFAHAIDDHLMRTTLVIRGEEWLASLPIHIQLFDILGFKRPKYGHTAQLMKLEDGRKRKLSKRLDPELSLEYYKQQGYHPLAVRTYLLTLLNSNFEEWFIANPDDSIENFRFSIENMGVSGALFDILKLNDVSKTIISKMDSNDVIEFFRDWIKEYNASALSIVFKSEDYLKHIIELGMGVGSKKPRKDYISASQIFEMISYYFDEYFKPTYEYSFEKDTVINILNRYTEIYNHSDDNSQWFDKIKSIADKFGFAVKLGDFKKNPEAYRGYVGDVAEIIRISVTGQKNTPDLWSIMQIIGEDCVCKRILETIEHLNHIV